MEKLRRDYPDIAPAGPTYVRGIRVGDQLFIAGCTARGTDAQSGPLVDQTRVTLDRIKRIVEREGGTMADVVKFTTYVTSVEEWRAHVEEINALFTEYFQGQYATNTLVQIGALALPGLDVEIEALVVL